MAKKACKNYKLVYEGDKCPDCGSKDATTEFKGKIIVVKPEQSEIAQKMNLKKQGTYAIKIK